MFTNCRHRGPLESLVVKLSQAISGLVVCLMAIQVDQAVCLAQHHAPPPPGAIRLGQPPMPGTQVRTPPSATPHQPADDETSEIAGGNSFFEEEQSRRVIKKPSPPVVVIPAPARLIKPIAKNYDLLEGVEPKDIKSIESKDPRWVSEDDMLTMALWYDREASKEEKPLNDIQAQLASVINKIDSDKKKISENSSKVDDLKEKQSKFDQANKVLEDGIPGVQKGIPNIKEKWFGDEKTSPTCARLKAIQEEIARLTEKGFKNLGHLGKQLKDAETAWNNEKSNMKVRLKWVNNVEKSKEAGQKISALTAENDRIEKDLQGLYARKMSLEYKESRLESQIAESNRRRDLAMKDMDARLQGNFLFWDLIQKLNPEFSIKPPSADTPKPVDKAQELKFAIDRQRNIQEQWNEYITNKFAQQQSSDKKTVDKETPTTQKQSTDWTTNNQLAIPNYGHETESGKIDIGVLGAQTTGGTGQTYVVFPKDIPFTVDQGTLEQLIEQAGPDFTAQQSKYDEKGFFISTKSIPDIGAASIIQQTTFMDAELLMKYGPTAIDALQYAALDMTRLIASKWPLVVGISMALVALPAVEAAAIPYAIAFGMLTTAQSYSEGHSPKVALVEGVASTIGGVAAGKFLSEAPLPDNPAVKAIIEIAVDQYSNFAGQAAADLVEHPQRVNISGTTSALVHPDILLFQLYLER